MPSLQLFEDLLDAARAEGFVEGYKKGHDDGIDNLGEKAARIAENAGAPHVAEAIRNMIALYKEHQTW